MAVFCSSEPEPTTTTVPSLLALETMSFQAALPLALGDAADDACEPQAASIRTAKPAVKNDENRAIACFIGPTPGERFQAWRPAYAIGHLRRSGCRASRRRSRTAG